MRAAIKLTIVLLAAVLVQCALEPCVEGLDQAQFVVRVAAAQMRGGPRDDPAMIDAAEQLRNRHWQRQARHAAAAHRAPPTTQLVWKEELEF